MSKTREQEAAEVEHALKGGVDRGKGYRALPPPKRTRPSGNAYRTPSIWDGAAYAPIALGETGLVGPYYDRSPDTRGRRNRGDS